MDNTVQKIPFLRLTIALAIGIILGSYFHIHLSIVFCLAIFNIAFLIFLNLKYKYRFEIIFGSGTFILLICIGMLVYKEYNKNPILYNNGNFIASVLETPQKKQNSYKTLIHIDANFKNDTVFKTSEDVIAYFDKNLNQKTLQPGCKIIFNKAPQTIENSGNPYEFDYKKFLERRKIYRQVFLAENSWITTDAKPDLSLKIMAEKYREKLLEIYRSQQLGEEQFEILSALTLGYKRELDPEIKSVFSAAGAMHVLAVSGLHVGIIYWVLTILLGFMKRKKYGRILFVLTSTTILWTYAFITGLSPSVERAATMFSILIIGDSLKRQINIYNSLAASAFILLVINPNNLFEVGFQLSYSAVFGIVYLQPKMEKLLTIKHKLLQYFWILFTVSVAAQIATFPISLYYFNQFPTYFWISNLLVIPAVTLLIPLGISLLVFSKIPAFAFVLSHTINTLIGIIYFILKEIEKLPFSVLHEAILPVELFLIAAILLLFFLFLKKPSVVQLKGILVCAFLIILSGITFKLNRLNKKEIIVYNNSNNTILQLISGKRNYIVSEKKISENDYAFNLVNNTIQNLHLKNTVLLTFADTLKDNFLYAQKGTIIFDNKTIIFNKSLNEIPEKLQPDFIIEPQLKVSDNTNNTKNTVFILNKSFFPRNRFPSQKIYTLSSEGAFRKIW